MIFSNPESWWWWWWWSLATSSSRTISTFTK